MKMKPVITSALTAFSLAATAAFAPAASADEVRCGSGPSASNLCRVDTSRGVELLVQHSGYPCYYNDTWGYDRNGIWVANGCSATFRVGNSKKDDNTAAAVGLGILALAILGAASDQGQDAGPPPPPPPSYPPNYGSGYPQGQQYADNGYDDQDDEEDDYEVVTCNSKNNKYKQCPIRITGHAELIRQKSGSACRFNKSWGYDRRGIWVNKGCRGDFAVYD